MHGTSSTTPLLVARVDARLVGLPLAVVIETMRPPPIAPLPDPPEAVAGVALLRGAPTPVLDGGVVLGGGRLTRPERLVSLRAGARRVGLLVDRVLGLREVPSARLMAPPGLLGPAMGRAVEALAVLDGELVATLGTLRLVPEELWAAVDARAEAR